MPVSVAEIAPVVFRYWPTIGLVTVTDMTQVCPALSPAPLTVIELPPAGATTVPGVAQVLVTPGVVWMTTPAGSVFVKATPLSEFAPFGFTSV